MRRLQEQANHNGRGTHRTKVRLLHADWSPEWQQFGHPPPPLRSPCGPITQNQHPHLIRRLYLRGIQRLLAARRWSFSRSEQQTASALLGKVSEDLSERAAAARWPRPTKTFFHWFGSRINHRERAQRSSSAPTSSSAAWMRPGSGQRACVGLPVVSGGRRIRLRAASSAFQHPHAQLARGSARQ